MQNIITDGAKSLNINSLPPEAWTIIRGGEGETDASKFMGAVAYYFACADTRIQSVGNMPYEVVRGDTVVLTSEDDTPAPRELEWLASMPDYFPMIEAGKILTGRAYLFNDRKAVMGRAMPGGLRWFNPYSVKPVISESEGLTGFTRRLKGRDVPYEVEDILYFWPADPFVELGPARHYPGKAAMASADVLKEMDNFIANYFERGLVKATLLSYLERMTPDEARETKEWWKRVTAGVKNAWNALVVRGDFKATVIGEGLKDLSDKTLTENEKQNIAVAFRVPMSMVFEKPGGLGDGTDNDERAFIERVIAPSCRHTAACFNRQLLNPLGLHLRFLPENLSIMQEDENQRSGALNNLVNAGIPIDIAATTLGYKFSDEEMARIVEGNKPQPVPPQLQAFSQQQPEQAFQEAAVAAVANERTKFRKWFARRANPDVKDFQSDLLTHGDKLELVEQMGGATAQDTPFFDTHEATKRVDKELENLIGRSASFFAVVYGDQKDRLAAWLHLHGAAGLDAFFGDDEQLVTKAVSPWFLHNLTATARQAFRALELTTDFVDVAAVIERLAEEMAADFAKEMTATSLLATEAKVAEWLAEGGTIGDLIEQLTPIWEGPRPDAAAVTESTRLLSRGRVDSWRASGVVSGYQPRHRNDDRVRERHRQIAADGPYSLDDTEHLPPYGDVNCRCWVVPVLT